MKRRGIFITFEGTEGAGKSTLIRLVSAQLEALGWKTRITREPGGSPVAERIRSTLLEEKMDPWTELFLYEAARAEHLAEVLHPALEAGQIALCDRFTDSSLAYQSHARGLPWKTVRSLNRIATQETSPDLTVLLDIDPAVGLARASDHNRFEAEGVKFQQKVRAGFLKIRREEPRRWFTLRVQDKKPEELAEAVVAEIQKRFKTKLKSVARSG